MVPRNPISWNMTLFFNDPIPYEKHPILLSRISVNPLLMVSGGRDCYPDFIYTQYVYTICVHLKVGNSLTRTDELQNMTRPVQTYSHKSNPRTGLVVCSVLHTRKIRWGGAGQGWDVNTFTCTCTHTLLRYTRFRKVRTHS